MTRSVYSTIIGPADAATRPQSVGRSVPGTDIRVIDSEGVELQWPATGELVGRSDMMMQGYLNRPDANTQIQWRDAKGNTFLRTGDIGAIDEEGFVTLRGDFPRNALGKVLKNELRSAHATGRQ